MKEDKLKLNPRAIKINDWPETHTEKLRWSLTAHYNRNMEHFTIFRNNK